MPLAPGRSLRALLSSPFVLGKPAWTVLAIPDRREPCRGEPCVTKHTRLVTSLGLGGGRLCPMGGGLDGRLARLSS